MKTAVSIPDRIFRSADAFAKRAGVSRSALYAAALTEYLARRRGRMISERLDAVYETEPSALDDALAKAQSRALTDTEW